MATCQAAANEFLRQFWLSSFPSPHEMRSATFSKFSEHREAKATKMISYLQSTDEKVEALFAQAQQLHLDPAMVEVVRPTLHHGRISRF
jgi:transcription initiation factor TFIIH subunit 1